MVKQYFIKAKKTLDNPHQLFLYLENGVFVTEINILFIFKHASHWPLFCQEKMYFSHI